MWGSDYPHFDSTFPESREVIACNFAGMPEDEQALILGGNMVRVYNLQDILEPLNAP
jgi:predicted TIM-barrel fold metal-dependent hydrolase